MNFEWAIKQLKEGKKVRRKGWGNKTLYGYGGDFIHFSDEGGDSNAHFLNEVLSLEATDWEIYEEGYYECPNCKKKLDKSFMGKQCGCGYWTYHHNCFKEGKKEIKKESLSDKIERIEFPNGVFHEVCYTDAVKEKIQNAKRRLHTAYSNNAMDRRSEHIDEVFQEEFGDKIMKIEVGGENVRNN